MGAQPLSREVALRVGLAARAMPGVEPRRLLEVLISRLGAPLTERRLAKITVTDLKTGLAGLDGEEDAEEGAIGMACLKQAVACLWGEGVQEPDLPVPQAYTEGQMPGSVRVACASNAAERLDGHFGSCPRFLIYQVSPREIRLIELRSTAGAEDSGDKNAFRAGLLEDCHLLYVQSIGGPAAAKVVKAGIHPVKIPEGGEAREVLARLQSVLAGKPPPWLARIMDGSAAAAGA